MMSKFTKKGNFQKVSRGSLFDCCDEQDNSQSINTGASNPTTPCSFSASIRIVDDNTSTSISPTVSLTVGPGNQSASVNATATAAQANGASMIIVIESTQGTPNVNVSASGDISGPFGTRPNPTGQFFLATPLTETLTMPFDNSTVGGKSADIVVTSQCGGSITLSASVEIV